MPRIVRQLLPGLLSGVFAYSCLAEAAAFEFDGQDYFLRSDESGILEYLPAGETFSKWNTLVSLREFKGVDDAHAYAAKLLATVKSSDPNAKGILLKSGDDYFVDFLIFSEEGTSPKFAEWNVWRIRAIANGLEAVQYGRRFYKFDEAAGKEINDEREKILGELSGLKIPN